jgi:hypothetical protein
MARRDIGQKVEGIPAVEGRDVAVLAIIQEDIGYRRALLQHSGRSG